MEEKIKDIYNAAWKIYKEYLADHNIAKFTDSAAELCKRYGNGTDVCGLMIWWSARVQGLHDAYLRGDTNGCN